MPLSKRLLPTDVVQLIEEVKGRNFMWDPVDPDYNDRNALCEAWKEIADKMKRPEIILRSKWKNLRDLFKKEVRKTDVTSVEQYKGRWRFFRMLWFLYKPNVVYYAEGPLQTESSVKFEPEFDNTDENEEDELKEDPKRRFPDEDNLSLSKRFKNGDDNYDMLFLKSLLPYFEALSPVRKLIVRNKIQKLLLDELAQTDEKILGE